MSIVILVSLTWPSTPTMRILDAVAACFLALEMSIAFVRPTTGRLLLEKWPCYVTNKDDGLIKKPYYTSYCFYWIQGKPVQAWHSESRREFLVYHPSAEPTAFFEGPFGPTFGLLSILNRLIRSRQASSRRCNPALLPQQDLTIWSDKSGWWRAFALYEECRRSGHSVSLCVVVHGEQTASHLENIWKQVREPKDENSIKSGYRAVEELNVIAAMKNSLGGRCDVGKFLKAFSPELDADYPPVCGELAFQDQFPRLNRRFVNR